MRFALPIVAALALAGTAAAQCPASGCPSEVTVTVRGWAPPAAYLPAPAAAPVQAWTVPSARAVQWYAAPAPVYLPMPASFAAPAACGAAPTTEYRYGPFGRLRRVVVR